MTMLENTPVNIYRKINTWWINKILSFRRYFLPKLKPPRFSLVLELLANERRICIVANAVAHRPAFHVAARPPEPPERPWAVKWGGGGVAL
jgi:hypothetical protein